MEQGTGKTIPALCRALELLKGGSVDSVLIVAPKSALGAWQRDIEQFDPADQEVLRRGVTLINYDKVWRYQNGVNPYCKPWGCIILDEAHNIKNRTSQRAKFLLKLALESQYRYILTGTPIGNGQLENIWSLYCFLDPYEDRGRIYSKIFCGSFYTFQDRYCILNQYWKPSSYINVAELQQIIQAHSYRVLKADCLDLPEKLPDEIIEIELQEKGLYKRLAKDSAIVELNILAENPLSRLVKLRQLASGFIQTDTGIQEVKTEKLDALNELLDGYNGKLVIFAEFVYSIEKITGVLKKRKIKHVTLDGRQKNKTIWREFQSDDSIQVIVCQYQSASVGVDLFAASCILYYEPTLRSITLEQSRDRIHRAGQTVACSYFHFITDGTVEKDIYKALSNFSDFSEKLFTQYMARYVRSYAKG